MRLDVSWGLNFAYRLVDLGRVQMASARVFTTSGEKSIEVGVSWWTESAVRLLTRHSSVVGLIKSCGGERIGFVSFCAVSLI